MPVWASVPACVPESTGSGACEMLNVYTVFTCPSALVTVTTAFPSALCVDTVMPVDWSNTGITVYRAGSDTCTAYSRRAGSKPFRSFPSNRMPVSSALWVAAVR